MSSAILALFFAMLASRWSSYWLQSRRVWAVRLTSVSFTGPRAFCRRFFVSASSFFFLSAVAVAMALAFVFSRAFFAAAAASAVSLAALISAATSVRSRRSARVGRMSTSVNTKVKTNLRGAPPSASSRRLDVEGRDQFRHPRLVLRDVSLALELVLVAIASRVGS